MRRNVYRLYTGFGKLLEVKIVYRDQNKELMNQYLTNASQSIPIVMILNRSDKGIEFGNELFQKFKNDDISYPKQKFMEDMQMAYNKDKGASIIEEIIDKITAVNS